MLEQQARPHSIQMQAVQQGLRRQFVQAFFGATALHGQAACRIQDQMERCQRRQRRCTGLYAGLVQQIQPRLGLA
ncbi:MAG: hypothetical protein RLZZ239_1922 [Pseudomonadota bacterium]